MEISPRFLALGLGKFFRNKKWTLAVYLGGVVFYSIWQR